MDNGLHYDPKIHVCKSALVLVGCSNKMPQTGYIINRNSSLTALVWGSQCRHGQVRVPSGLQTSALYPHTGGSAGPLL